MFTEAELSVILQELLSKPAETEIVEFKRAQNNFDDDEIGKYFSALSNEANLKDEKYAWLVFGVDNNTHALTNTQYKISRPSLDAMKKKIGDQTTNRITFEEIYDFQINGNRVVMFQIPATPKGIPMAYQGHYYGRDGESLVALNLQEIEHIRSQVNDTSFEFQPAKSNLTAQEVLRYLNYAKLYERINKRVPTDEQVVLQLLEEYSYAVNEHGSWSITNMGAILFANHLSDFDKLRFREIVLRRYEGNSNLVLIGEKRSEAGYAVEFDGLVDWLENNSSKEKIETLRTIEPSYPKIAIREFLANIMVHQDFSISGMPLTVEIFGNRMVFTNPGSSLNAANRLIDLPPRSRNEELAQSMLVIDMCERRGSGYDRAVGSIEAMFLPPYKAESGDNYTRITMYPKKKFNDMSQQDKLNACYQHACLLYENGQELSNTSLRERFNLDAHKSSVVSRVISDAITNNMIKPSTEGNQSKKFSTYIPFYA